MSRAEQDLICLDASGIERLVGFGSDIPTGWTPIRESAPAATLADGADFTAGATLPRVAASDDPVAAAGLTAGGAMGRVVDGATVTDAAPEPAAAAELKQLRDEHEQLTAAAAGRIEQLTAAAAGRIEQLTAALQQAEATKQDSDNAAAEMAARLQAVKHDSDNAAAEMAARLQAAEEAANTMRDELTAVSSQRDQLAKASGDGAPSDSPGKKSGRAGKSGA